MPETPLILAINNATITTQRGTVVNLDREGKPLRPAIIWLDQRHARVDGPVKGPWGWLFKLGRLEDTISRFREKTQANWIAQNQPDIWAKTHKYLLLSGYLNYRLTGEFRDSPGVRQPGPEAKGSIIGFGDVHTRAHVYRAILEGLASALKEGKERIEKRSGHAIDG